VNPQDTFENLAIEAGYLNASNSRFWAFWDGYCAALKYAAYTVETEMNGDIGVSASTKVATKIRSLNPQPRFTPCQKSS
jgi:hypothetical protein